MTDPDDLSARAGQVLAEAAALPSAGQVADLADRAIAHGGTRNMSPEEIRRIADEARAGAEQIAVLMRRLSDIFAPPDPGAGRE